MRIHWTIWLYVLFRWRQPNFMLLFIWNGVLSFINTRFWFSSCWEQKPIVTYLKIKEEIYLNIPSVLKSAQKGITKRVFIHWKWESWHAYLLINIFIILTVNEFHIHISPKILSYINVFPSCRVQQVVFMHVRNEGFNLSRKWSVKAKENWRLFSLGKLEWILCNKPVHWVGCSHRGDVFVSISE